MKPLESKCKLEVPPGGVKGERRGRLSDYGVQLREKQKLRRMYGVLESQFRNYYIKAAAARARRARRCCSCSRARLDNVVYRMGFAATRNEARQLVSHRAIAVNGGDVNIASYQCKAGDVVGCARRRRSSCASRRPADHVPGRLSRRGSKSTRRSSRRLKPLPEREEILPDINENLVVELYSK